MTDYVTDTHGLIWYLEDSPRLGVHARQAFDDCDQAMCSIIVPTICLVEIVYLQEKARIPGELFNMFIHDLRSSESGLLLANLTLDVVNALAKIDRVQVPDMPDRIIAATALHLRLPLISRDRQIRSTVLETVW